MECPKCGEEDSKTVGGSGKWQKCIYCGEIFKLKTNKDK